VATLQIRPMTFHDVKCISLRDWEADEVRGLGLDPQAALAQTFYSSQEAFAVSKEGQLLLLTGHWPRSMFGGSGIAWMFVTPEGNDNWRELVRLSKKIVAQLSRIYLEVYVATYPQNETAIRFLEWHGFERHSQLGNTLTMVKH
jgi:ribosomal protein S18 acetylase RimI-like enzyme